MCAHLWFATSTFFLIVLRPPGLGVCPWLKLFSSLQTNLEAATASLTQRNELLTVWLAEMEPKQHNPLDADSAVQPIDVYSKQMIELQAEDRAIDDTIAVLEEALHDSKITLTQYLKHVRTLGEKQFKARALTNKILAAQRQLTGPGRP